MHVIAVPLRATRIELTNLFPPMDRRRFTTTAAAAFALAGLPVAARAAAAAPALDWPGRRWDSVRSDDAGWNADELRTVDAAARELRSDAVMIVHRGLVVHEYGDVARPLDLYSVRKSLLSVLFGIHHARVDLRATMGELGIDDEQGLSATEKAATVQQLLQSRSGIYHGAAYETSEMAAARPPRGSHLPGSHWYYNNWDFNALGTVFRRCTGNDVFDALAADLAGPLQWQDFDPARHTRWHHDSVSRHPAYVMQLSARDLARVGLLMARDGRWGGQMLLPSAWVDESTRVHSMVPPGWQGYGYMWWAPLRAWPFWQRNGGDVFFAWGNHGQFLFVDRARDLVVVHRTTGPSLWRRPVDPEAVSPLLARILEAVPA